MSGVLGNNIFAALSKKKKKISSKDDGGAKEEEAKVDKHAEIEKAIFSAPVGGMSNWADDLEDDWGAPAPAAADDGWNQVR
jgi:hypothetical protein